MGPPPRATPTETPDDRILAAAAGQAAASRSQAAASMLLLLAYVGSMRSLGAFTVSCSQLQHIQQSVVPAVNPPLCQLLASSSHAYCISCMLISVGAQSLQLLHPVKLSDLLGCAHRGHHSSAK